MSRSGPLPIGLPSRGLPASQLDAMPIVCGFKKVCRVFLTHQSDLLDANGPVARFRDDETRIDASPHTHLCSLARREFHPDVMRNALDRDQMFDLLWGTFRSPHLSRVISANARIYGMEMCRCLLAA